MTKDIFALTFSHLSEFEAEEYHTEYIERLPFLMLRTAADSYPEIATLSGFAHLYEFLNIESPHHWNNPELYSHLLLLQCPEQATCQLHLDAIKTHVGLTPPTTNNFCNRRFLRLRVPHAQVLELCNSNVVEIDGIVFQEKDRGSLPLVYRPHPNLFDDVAKDLYLGTQSALRPADLGMRVKNALSELHRYCPQLAAAFCKSVGTISFTGDDLASVRSYSMRLFYVGGIFSAICDPIALVENFIHEYYHSCLWTWWLLEQPADLPPAELTMISPITQTRKPVVVMMHALLIYASLIDYYRFVLAGPQSESHDPYVIKETEKRLETIATGTPALVDSLHTILHDRPGSRRWTSFVSDIIKSSTNRV